MQDILSQTATVTVVAAARKVIVSAKRKPFEGKNMPVDIVVMLISPAGQVDSKMDIAKAGKAVKHRGRL
jgi:hypothetical protein